MTMKKKPSLRTWWALMDKVDSQFGRFDNEKEAKANKERFDKKYPEDGPHRVVKV